MGHAHRVLIVDDDAEFRAVLREVLEDEGCAVVEAPDGKSALGVLRSAAAPELILLDLMMPVMNGWDFHPSIAGIPIAVLSGVGRMRPFGAMHELHKPVDLPNLLGLLHALDAPDQPATAIQLPLS